MKKLLLLLIASFPLPLFPQDISWEKSCGGKHDEILFDAISTPDYGFILAGSSVSRKGGNKHDESHGNYDYCIWKLTENGEFEWQKSYGGANADFLKSVQLTNDGGYILGGTSYSDRGNDKMENSKGESDFWIIKLDAKGNQIWQRTIGGKYQDQLEKVIQTPDGGFIIAGSSSSNKEIKGDKLKDEFYKSEDCRGGLDFWVVKLTGEGTIEWQKTIGGNYDDHLKSIVLLKKGGFLIGGSSNSSISHEKKENTYGDNDYWVLKLNNQGTIEWQQTIGGSKDDNLNALIQTSDGGYMIGGSSNSEITKTKNKGNGNGTDFWIIKLAEDGTIIWQETYNKGKIDILNSIVENKDGTLLLGGYAQSEASRISVSNVKSLANDKEGINDYIALKITSTGEVLWSKTVGSKDEDILTTVFETRDGGYIFSGTSSGSNSRDKSSNVGGKDFWIVKIKDTTKPEKEKISIEAFPNPAQSFSNVVINFDYIDGVALLYDLNGRVLKEEKIKRQHTIPIDLSDLPEGIYVATIKTNVGEKSIKLIKK